MKLNRKVIEQIYKHALEEYPNECCGIVIGYKHNQTVHLCENIQNRLHTEDPGRYPRDARTAYVIDRKEFDRIVSEVKDRGEDVIAFYHSHPEHESYFSADDAAAQTVFGEPEFPDALHVVISVRSKKIHDMKCFKWDRDKQEFIMIDGSN